MKRISLFILVAVLPVLTFADDVPFRSSGSALESVVSEVNPYILEVAYALVPMSDDEVGADSVRAGSRVPSERFFDAAQRLRVSISDDDQGWVSSGNWPEFLYSVERRNEGFLLKFYLRTELDGRQEIDTRVNLVESEWLLLTGMRREGQNSENLEYQVAFRISPIGREGVGGNAE